MNRKAQIVVIILFIIAGTFMLFVFYKSKTSTSPSLYQNTQTTNSINPVNNTTNPINNPASSAGQVTATVGVSMAELAKHNNASDCWMKIDNNAYNVTAYVGSHPGGGSILRGCGQDATSMYYSVRKHNATNLFNNFFVGPIQ